MAYCSVEEAWGAPLTPPPSMFENSTCESESEPKLKKQLHKQEVYTVAPPKSEQFDGSITDPPLRGSLLGGSIPDPFESSEDIHPTPKTTQSTTKKLVEFKSNDGVTQRLDQLIDILSKKNCTSWTDVLVFVFLGIFAIVAMDLFFRFGKWMITKSNSLPNSGVQQYVQFAPQPPSQIPPQVVPQVPQVPPPSAIPSQLGGYVYYHR
tara:strand:+ start:133 stop:753 length:621 start_codon:yes stop_codon:yes gene_type:complete